MLQKQLQGALGRRPVPAIHRRAHTSEGRAHGQRGKQLRCQSSSEAAVQAADAPAPDQPSTVPRSTVWELDFCSRPLLDERGKKVWELLITDPERSFEYAQYFPNSKINSVEVGWDGASWGGAGSN